MTGLDYYDGHGRLHEVCQGQVRAAYNNPWAGRCFPPCPANIKLRHRRSAVMNLRGGVTCKTCSTPRRGLRGVGGTVGPSDILRGISHPAGHPKSCGAEILRGIQHIHTYYLTAALAKSQVNHHRKSQGLGEQRMACRFLLNDRFAYVFIEVAKSSTP